MLLHTRCSQKIPRPMIECEAMDETKCKSRDKLPSKCLFVCHTFPPIAAVGIYRTLRFMHHMPSFDWEGIVVAMKEDAVIGHPVDHSLCDRVPQGAVIERTGVWRPLDRLIKWVKRLVTKIKPKAPVDPPEGGSDESVSGQNSAATDRGLMSRLRGFLVAVKDTLFYTPDNCVNWVGPAVIAGCRLARRHRPHVIFSSGPPHSAHLAGLGIHLLTRIPLMIDLRDPWASDEWLNQEDYRFRMWLQKKLERLCVRFADRVILNTERLRQNFINAYPQRWHHKFIAIPNGVDDYIVEPVRGYLRDANQRSEGSPLTLCHPGSIYWHRSLLPMIEAIRHLKQSGGQVQFEQIGLIDHPPDLAERLVEWDLPEVHLRGRLSHEETLKQMAKSDVLVVIQPMSTLQVPAKLYEMLTFRKPILVITKDGATADVINEYKIGLIADPADPMKISDAIRELDLQMKAESFRGDWDRAIHAFDSRNLTSQLVNVMNQITN